MWLKGIKFDRLAPSTPEPFQVTIPLPHQDHLPVEERKFEVIRARNGFSAVTQAAATLRRFQAGQITAEPAADPYEAIIAQAQAFNENARLVREREANALGLELVEPEQ